MNQLTASYRQITGYTIKGSALLGVFGFMLILFTFPNFFYRLSAEGLPVGMAPIIDLTRGVAGQLIDGSRIRFIDSVRLPLTVALPVTIWLLIGATGVRAIRARSWRPVVTMGVHLGLGIVAFPLFAWGVQLVFWVIGFGLSVMSWVDSLRSGGMGGVVQAVGLMVLAVIGVAVAVGVIWLMVASRKARWVVAGVAVTVGIIYLVKDFLAVLLGPLWEALVSGVGSAGSAVSYGLGFVVLAVWAVVAWLLALLLLAYLGSTMWTPLRDAARSGRQIDRFADVSAGVGVAASTLITAAVYNADFAGFMEQAAETRQALPGVQALPSVLDMSFAQLMPASFHDFFVMLFKGFSGAPDVLLIIMACAIGILSLAFTPGSLAAPTGKPTILTLGFLRVGIAMAAVTVVLFFTSFDSS